MTSAGDQQPAGEWADATDEPIDELLFDDFDADDEPIEAWNEVGDPIPAWRMIEIAREDRDLCLAMADLEDFDEFDELDEFAYQ